MSGVDGMGLDNPKIKAMQARSDPNVYVQYWRVPLMKTCTQRPGYCCYALFCGYCASYGLRKQALHGDLSRYLCCNGGCPCSGRCGEQSCPEFCLCMEVVMCFSMSVQTTRYMVQDELRIQTTKCDNCLIGTAIVLEYVACICHCIACITGSDEIRAAAQIVQIIADVMWCTVCACMQTQHKAELDERDKNPGGMPQPITHNTAQFPHMQAPGQQMIPMGNTNYQHQQQPHTYPQGGYPPQQQYQGYPPQQQGYPPQGYPPQGGYYPPQGYYPQQGPSGYGQEMKR